MTINRNLIVQAFPNQPQMQAAFESLVADADDAVSRLNAALAAITDLSNGAEGIVAQLAKKQPKNDTLSAVAQLPTDPGVLEQIQPGIVSIRAIDTADTASLVTRALGDSRWLGGAHGAASAAKLTTARSISITGDMAWSVTFDGSANVSAAGTIQANAVTFSKLVAATQKALIGANAAGNFQEITLGSGLSLTAGVLSATSSGVTSVTGTAPIVSSGGTTPAISITGSALTKTDDTNVTLTLGGTPTTALIAATSLTLGWTGQLAVGRGGTGIASFAVGDILYASAATTLSKLADVATGNVLISGGVTTAPAWGKVGLTTHVSGTLGVGNGGTGVTSSTGSGSNVLSASPTMTGIATLNTDGTNGYLFITGNAVSGSGVGVLTCFDGTGGRIGTLDWSGTTRKTTGFYGSSISFNIGANATTSPAMNITSALAVNFPGISTTASAANAFLDGAASNNLLRSTSSKRYKRDIENLEDARADALLSLRPVWYRSKAERDNPAWGWYGLIAEEVAKVDPRLVHWGYWPEDYFQKKKTRWLTDLATGERHREIDVTHHLRKGAKLRPDAVQYDRVAVLLLSVVQRQEERLRVLEARS